jgi:putative membrane protein
LPRIPGGVAPWAAAHAVAFWLWHTPPAYAAALSSDALFWAMQISLILTAIGLWSAVRRAAMPVAIMGLLATMVQMGLLGALLTFAGHAHYAPHFTSTLAWGIAPVEDQQLAGLMLWAPGSALYLFAALAIGWRALAPAPRPAAV